MPSSAAVSAPSPSLTDDAAPSGSPSAVADAASDTAKPRRLLISVFGLFVRAEARWISVAALIRLLDDLGVGEQAVRSSISRLKRRGVLVGSRSRGAAGYSPSPELDQTLLEGDHRIFGRDRATVADGWVTVSFSVPEHERKKRHELRSALAAHGFGIMAPGVWIAPGTLAEETPELLRRRHLSGYVTMLHGAVVDTDPPAESLTDRVARWWNLGELAAQYQQFIDTYDAIADDLAGADDRRAFATYVPMVTAWRRLPYLDPGLPLEVLPSPWPGARATELFHRLHGLLSAGASRHASAVMADATSAQA